MSVKPSARSSSSATYCGAMQMTGCFINRTVVVSSTPSAARNGGPRTRPAAPANERVVKNCRRVWVTGIRVPPCQRLCLQLAFELVQEPPIGALGDDLLRARLDDSRFVQAQGIEPDGILGVVFPP